MVEHKSNKPLAAPSFLRHIPGVNYEKVVLRSDFWGKYAKSFRSARNYLLYYHPKFERSSVFRSRAYGWVDPHLRSKLPQHNPPSPSFVHFLENVEEAIPPSPEIMAYLKSNKFDLVLVSPLIFYQNLFQHDYVKAAHALGMPVGFPVFSWDNLTTKGNIQVMPDRIWVWNDIQRSELEELHGVDPDIIGVMGAWRFDEFRSLSASLTWEEFCARHNFDPSKRLITYLGSSPAIAPREGEFVKRWVEGIRGCDDPFVREANILVRAHPRNVEAWKGENHLKAFERLYFDEPSPNNFFDTQNLYNALYYCGAVVGLNTSAMLEAAILHRPVHTVADDSVRQGHEGTVHFEYLTKAGGGLLYQADSFPEHFKLLAKSIANPVRTSDSRAVSFERAFIDDGSRHSPTDRLVSEFEELAELKKQATKQPARNWVRGLQLKTMVWSGAIKVDRDPDFINSFEQRSLSVATGVSPFVKRTLARIDRTRSLEAHLVTYAAGRIGHKRVGPKHLDGMPLRVRSVAFIGRRMIGAGVRTARLLGLHGRLSSAIGRQLVEYDPTLPKVHASHHTAREAASAASSIKGVLNGDLAPNTLKHPSSGEKGVTYLAKSRATELAGRARTQEDRIEALESRMRETVEYQRSQAESLRTMEIAHLKAQYAGPDLPLALCGEKSFSQHGEDGIIAEIFSRLDTQLSTFVEIGAGAGDENNSILPLISGARGLWVEADPENAAAIRMRHEASLASGQLTLIEQSVTAENADEIVSRLVDPRDIDILSIDIDGNDYWVWKAVVTARPKLVTVEYNARFGSRTSWTMAYDPNHRWAGKTIHFGASLKAFECLGRAKGYKLVGTDYCGANAFFLRDDLVSEKFPGPHTSEALYQPLRRYVRSASAAQTIKFGPFERP